MFKAQAPAKINLFLNVVGRRGDGYHLLESLFVPVPGLYDEITVEPASSLVCEMEGGGAQITDNIVLKVAGKLKPGAGARITINKRIPVAAGLGGGSSDAACAFKLLCKLWGIEMARQEQIDFAVGIGADVPFFIDARPSFVQGIGEIIEHVNVSVGLPVLLVNPGVEVSTPAIFKMGFESFSPQLANPDLVELIYTGKNDLQPNAIKIAPSINDVLHQLQQATGCKVSRMSGAGATCFGIFEDLESARKAQANMPAHWWSWCGYLD